jgi:hypothetical protein
VNNSYQPQARPLSALLPTIGKSYQKSQQVYPVPQVIKTDLTVDKGPTINIGTSHNRAPMPFNRNVGTSMVYQAQKPTNWTPGDYTHLNEPSYNGTNYMHCLIKNNSWTNFFRLTVNTTLILNHILIMLI